MKMLELVLRSPDSYSLLQKIHSRIKRRVNLWAVPVMLMFALFLSACGGGGGGDTSANQMEFVVTVPANTPLEDTIYLQVGGNWRSTFQMEKIGDRIWRVGISETALTTKQANLGLGTRELSYAYTRGVDAIAYFGGEFFDDDPDVDAWSEHRKVNFAEGSMQSDLVQRWRFSPEDGEVLPTMSAQLTAFEPRHNGLEFQAGVQINDFWPASVPAEQSSGFDMIESTSQAVENARATWVQIAPVWDYEQILPTPILNPPPEGEAYPDAALRKQIRNLKSHGFKIFLLIQVCCNEPNDAFTQGADAAWWDAWYAQIENFILFYARLAEEEGVDAIALAQSNNLYNTAPADRIQRWEAIQAKLRLAYGGLFGYTLSTLNSCCSYSPTGGYFNGGIEEIAHLLDFIAVYIWAGIADNVSPAQEHLDTNAEALFAGAIDTIFTAANVPIIVPLAFASYDGGAVNAIFVDDIAYIPGFPEKDSLLAYDGIEQAMVYQAIMKAVARRPHVTGLYPFGYNWVTMPLAPVHGIRGKAAEKVLAEWYDSISIGAGGSP